MVKQDVWHRKRLRMQCVAHIQDWSCCSHCGQSVHKCKMRRHRRKECPTRVVECETCGVRCAMCDLQDHKEKECEGLPMVCGLCGESITRGGMNYHTHFECQCREVSCPNRASGCQWLGAHQALDSHRASCKHAPTSCELCLEELQRGEMPKHTCPRVRGEETCVVCLETFQSLAQVNVPPAILISGTRRACDHFAMCLGCARRWTSQTYHIAACPICRAPFDS